MSDYVEQHYRTSTKRIWKATFGRECWRTHCTCGWVGQWWYSAARAEKEQARHSDLRRIADPT